jgi:hypothetical protein
LYIDIYMALWGKKLPFRYRRRKGVTISYVYDRYHDDMSTLILIEFSAGVWNVLRQ